MSLEKSALILGICDGLSAVIHLEKERNSDIRISNRHIQMNYLFCLRASTRWSPLPLYRYRVLYQGSQEMPGNIPVMRDAAEQPLLIRIRSYKNQLFNRPARNILART